VLDQFVLCNDPLAMLEKEQQQGENLRLDGHLSAVGRHFEFVSVD
jgi:hypothetical protein